VENVCGAHFEAQPGYDGCKPKIPMMFPGCIHGKEKTNDETLLQSIRDGNSLAVKLRLAESRDS
jgi:hypothetical protein